MIFFAERHNLFADDIKLSADDTVLYKCYCFSHAEDIIMDSRRLFTLITYYTECLRRYFSHSKQADHNF